MTLETIQLEQQYIKSQMSELTELERWRVREGLEKNEPYIYPSVRKRLEQQDQRQRDHALHVARDEKHSGYTFRSSDSCLECQASYDNK